MHFHSFIHWGTEPIFSPVQAAGMPLTSFDVVMDSQLSLDVHVAALCLSAYYRLQQLRPVARSLPTVAAKNIRPRAPLCPLYSIQ